MPSSLVSNLRLRTAPKSPSIEGGNVKYYNTETANKNPPYDDLS